MSSLPKGFFDTAPDASSASLSGREHVIQGFFDKPEEPPTKRPKVYQEPEEEMMEEEERGAEEEEEEEEEGEEGEAYTAYHEILGGDGVYDDAADDDADFAPPAEEPEDFDIADEEEGVEGGIGSVLGKRKEGESEDGADPL
mmetsp:Transcript_38556/g.91039  ORF Transcript_38556/g.91039 Transcript_38556/m.91039 type:complete len:142 (+) Transcript_38556:195-620(+)